MPSPTIFVIGATGAQGGAVARALLSNNYQVHALVRDPTSTASQALKSQGASLFEGDWDNAPALEAAAAGCTGAFVNVYPLFDDWSAEIRHGKNILAASKRAGVKHVVYASVLGANHYETFYNPEPNTFHENYFRSKRTIEGEVQNGDFETWTILRGATFMSNFLLPSSMYMFPELSKDGRFISGYSPETKLLLIDPEDIGSFGFAAFSSPEKYGGRAIDIAAESLGVEQIIKTMEKVSEKKIKAKFFTASELEAQKDNPLIKGQSFARMIPPWFKFEETRAWGVKLHSFEEFLARQKDRVQTSIGEELLS
jgi:uncharacterized protein YbjT (DUF2867 family)